MAVLGRRLCAVLAVMSAMLHLAMLGHAGNAALTVGITAMALACLYCGYELWRVGYGGGAGSTAQKLEAQSKLNFRLVEVVMMLMLPLLAVSLAIPPKRSSSALGIFIGIVIVVAYHKVNQYAQQAGAQGRIDPVVALWTPLVFLSALIFWMYHVLAHRPGGQPIAALERAFARVGKMVRAAVPRPRDGRAEAA